MQPRAQALGVKDANLPSPEGARETIFDNSTTHFLATMSKANQAQREFLLSYHNAHASLPNSTSCRRSHCASEEDVTSQWGTISSARGQGSRAFEPIHAKRILAAIPSRAPPRNSTGATSARSSLHFLLHMHKSAPYKISSVQIAFARKLLSASTWPGCC